jgi:phosphatidylethanolamine/phosphatidyl-N-methylethanolamine N-methyltransferase
VLPLPDEHWTFFRAFLKAPRVVASVMPSSSLLEQRVVRAADPQAARVVVEFGGGTGGITRALLQAAGPQARVLVIERTAEFIESLERIHDSRLEVVHGCASSVGAELARAGHPAVDAVVSGIPFSTLPEVLAAEIVGEVHQALAPGGRFVAYQFSDAVADYARPVMGEPEVQHELRNMPPLKVFTWRKEAGRPGDGRKNGAEFGRLRDGG